MDRWSATVPGQLVQSHPSIGSHLCPDILGPLLSGGLRGSVRQGEAQGGAPAQRRPELWVCVSLPRDRMAMPSQRTGTVRGADSPGATPTAIPGVRPDRTVQMLRGTHCHPLPRPDPREKSHVRPIRGDVGGAVCLSVGQVPASIHHSSHGRIVRPRRGRSTK